MIPHVRQPVQTDAWAAKDIAIRARDVEIPALEAVVEAVHIVPHNVELRVLAVAVAGAILDVQAAAKGAMGVRTNAVAVEAPVLTLALGAVMDAEAAVTAAQVVPEHVAEDVPRLVHQAVATLVLVAKPVLDVRQTVQRVAEMGVWHPAWLPPEDRETRSSLTGRQIRMEPEQNIIRGIPSKAHKTWIFGRSGNTSMSQLTAA